MTGEVVKLDLPSAALSRVRDRADAMRLLRGLRDEAGDLGDGSALSAVRDLMDRARDDLILALADREMERR